MEKTQKGIALIESLLIILILVIVGFAGYYVWHTQVQTNKNNTDSVKTNRSSVVPSTKPITSSSQKYLTIQEWGIKIPLSSTIDDAYYSYHISKECDFKYCEDNVGLSLLPLKNTGCGADQLPPVWIFRVKDGTQVDVPGSSVTAPTDSVAQLSGYDYYWYRGSSGACSTNNTQEQLAESVQQSFVDALKNIQSD